MKKLPIGISNLREITQDGYTYIDKTKFVSDLANTGKYYFLSRPRRFGKTLFIDTLKEVFEGNKELFQDLWIYDKWNWSVRYPVIHISLAEGTVRDRAELDRKIIDILLQNQERLNTTCRDTTDVSSCFGELIRKTHAHTGMPVVILVDEYDKPILDNITEPKTAKEMREGLKNLYSVIKGRDANIKFAFLTGVSKFSKVSIFSGLNNLEDITLNESFAAVCGYTEDELTSSFEDHLHGKDIDEIRHWYNGYSWLGERVYNPFSIINYLKTGHFRNYWFESGTPTFLIELLREKKYYIPQIENIEAGESLIGSFDVDFIEPENILFQAGYLTIVTSYMQGSRLVFRLTYPNTEVKSSLNDYLLSSMSHNRRLKEDNQGRLYNRLMGTDVEGIRDIMQSHFASIPHDWYRKNGIDGYEGYYASVFYSYFASLGLDIRVEDATNHGKVDMTVLMAGAVFIFEFKVMDGKRNRGETAGTALEQIKMKGYADKYRSMNLPIYLVGIEFDREERNITNFQWEKTGNRAEGHQ